jgi:acetylornithine aminotransferase
LAVFRVLLDGRILDQARRMGEYLGKGLSECKDRHHVIRDVRGLGLLHGMEVAIDARTVVGDCLKRGLLINATGEHVLRLVPPLIISQPEIDRLLDVLSHIFDRHAAQSAAH